MEIKWSRHSVIVLVFAGIILILAGCTLIRQGKNFRYFYNPPGTNRLAPNFYCDETEVTNLSWLLYLDWMRRIFGSGSDEYRAALPDTGVWLQHDSCLNEKVHYYFRHPNYCNHPVVGITQLQAQNYTKWREDRVFERYLVVNGVFDRTSYLQTDEDYFTIDRYLAGEFQDLVPDTSIKYCVRYNLPSLDQWRHVLRYNDSIIQVKPRRRTPRYMRDLCEDYPEMVADVSPCDSNRRHRSGPEHVDSDCRHRWGVGFQNLRGNVSEWLLESNLSAGGGWCHSVERIKASDTFTDSLPNAWTGFRNVATWEKLK